MADCNYNNMASDDSPETEKLIPSDSEEVEEERAPPDAMKVTKKGSVTSDMEVSPALLNDTIDLSSDRGSDCQGHFKRRT